MSTISIFFLIAFGSLFLGIGIAVIMSAVSFLFAVSFLLYLLYVVFVFLFFVFFVCLFVFVCFCLINTSCLGY